MKRKASSAEVSGQAQTLGAGIRHGLVWSSMNALVLRLGTFAMGIFLARILLPEQFGVFAVALTVQAILMTLADFGLSTDLIRSKNHVEKAPTVATLGLVLGGALFLLMFASAQATADLLGSPSAGPVIAVMSVSLFLAGLGVVPYAKLQRDFQQKRLFMIGIIDFVVVNSLTVLLVLLGWGVMALAVGRIAAQFATLIAQYILAGVRPRFGFDRSLVATVLRFGLPVALANLLSWLLLNVDNIAVSRLAGPLSLGFYYLAFNISNWPVSMLGQVVRSLSLPAFSRVIHNSNDDSLGAAAGPVWSLGLLAGFMLALLADPVIRLVYGERWAESAPILMALGLFGTLRMLFDLFASYLLAKGYSSLLLIVQVAWLAGLVPLMILGVGRLGALGAGLAHVAISLVVVGPAYFIVLHIAKANLRLLARQLVVPLAAAMPSSAAAYLAMQYSDSLLGQLLLGGCTGTTIYALLLFKWFARCLRMLRSYAAIGPSEQPVPAEPASSEEPVPANGKERI